MNASQNDSDILCQRANSLFTLSYYRGILIGECIIGSLAIVPNVLFLTVVWRAIVLPSNLRLLLGHLSLIFFLFSIGDLIKCLYTLIEDPCKFNFSIRQCRIFDLATTWLVLPNIFYALMPLCIERLYATINYRIYDSKASQQKPWLAFVLIFCAWTTAMCINGISIFSLPNDQYIPMCDTLFVPLPTKPMNTFLTYIVLEIGAGWAICFIYVYNRQVATSMAINRAKYNLSARFQIDQNIQVNRMMIPCMILHFFFHLPSFTLTLISTLSTVLDFETKMFLNRTTILLRLVYSLLHPIAAFYFNAHLRHHLAEGPFGRAMSNLGIKISKGKNVGTRMAMADAAEHFNHLDKMWTLTKSPPNPSGLKPKKTFC